jgi:hypothetical protein
MKGDDRKGIFRQQRGVVNFSIFFDLIYICFELKNGAARLNCCKHWPQAHGALKVTVGYTSSYAPSQTFLQCLKSIIPLTSVRIRRRWKQVCHLQSRPYNQFHPHITLGDSDPPQELQNQRLRPEFVDPKDSISSKYLKVVEKQDRDGLEFIATVGDKTVIFVSPYISCSPFHIEHQLENYRLVCSLLSSQHCLLSRSRISGQILRMSLRSTSPISIDFKPNPMYLTHPAPLFWLAHPPSLHRDTQFG